MCISEQSNNESGYTLVAELGSLWVSFPTSVVSSSRVLGPGSMMVDLSVAEDVCVGCFENRSGRQWSGKQCSGKQWSRKRSTESNGGDGVEEISADGNKAGDIFSVRIFVEPSSPFILMSDNVRDYKTSCTFIFLGHKSCVDEPEGKGRFKEVFLSAFSCLMFLRSLVLVWFLYQPGYVSIATLSTLQSCLQSCSSGNWVLISAR